MSAETPPANAAADPAAPVSKLGYVTFDTPDVARMTRYYTEVLDFEVVDRSGDYVYLPTGSDRHSVVLRKAEQSRPRSAVGYEVWGSVADAHRRLHDAGYQTERRSGVAPGTPDVVVLRSRTTGIPTATPSNCSPNSTSSTTSPRGYFEPRPWHKQYPQYPRTWEVDIATINMWGPVNEEELQR